MHRIHELLHIPKVLLHLAVSNELQDVVAALSRDPQTYITTNAADTNTAGPRATIARALASEHLYLQFGLSEQDPLDNPVAKAADTPGVVSDTSHSVPTANPRMHACVAALHKPFQHYFVIMLRYLAALEDQMVLTNVPVWVNGNFMAITKTHYDDYLNFVVVLKGRKFFYLADPVHVDGKDYGGHLNEASDVIPTTLNDEVHVDCESSHRPPDYDDRRRNTTYVKEAKNMSRITIRAGQMLAIPPGWWHYVVSDPGTVMLNFWFDKVDDVNIHMAIRWSILLDNAASTVRESSCLRLAAASAADGARVNVSTLELAEAAVNLSAKNLACVKNELELQLKIDEAAVQVAGLRECLQQTKAPVEVDDGSGWDELLVGNKEVPQVHAVEPTSEVEAAFDDVRGMEEQQEQTSVVEAAIVNVGEIEEQQEQQQEACLRCTMLNDVGSTSCICDEDRSNAPGPPRRHRAAHLNSAESFKFGQNSSRGSIPPEHRKAKQNASSLRGTLAPATAAVIPVKNADDVLETVDADVLIQTGDRVQGNSRQNNGLLGTALKPLHGLPPRVNVRWDNGTFSVVRNKRSCLVLIPADSTGGGADKVPKPPDTEKCMKCESVAFTSDDTIFFCATCAQGKPGLHLSCARNAGLAVPLNGDVTQDAFVFQCNACRQQPISGENPLIMKADLRAETITAGPNDSTSSIADVLSEVRTAILAPGLLPGVSQPNLRILLNVCELKLKYLVSIEANEETARQTVADALFILTFAAAPINHDSKHQVLTTMAHGSPGVSRDIQFLHLQYAKIANAKQRSWITNEKEEAGKRYITARGDLKITDIPFIARNLMIHSILTDRLVGGGLAESMWNRLPLEDDGVLPLPQTAEYGQLSHHVPRVPTLIGNATGLPNNNQDPHCDCKWTAEGVPEDSTSFIFFIGASERACLGFYSVDPQGQDSNDVVSFPEGMSVGFNGAHYGVKGSGNSTSIRLHVYAGKTDPSEYDACTWSCVRLHVCSERNPIVVMFRICPDNHHCVRVPITSPMCLYARTDSICVLLSSAYSLSGHKTKMNSVQISSRICASRQVVSLGR